MEAPIGSANGAVEHHPVLAQIDHAGIHADDPEGLFRFFTETLGLPVVFPYVAFGPYAAAGVSLGNAFLEVSRFGAPHPARRRARPFILGFLVRPGGLPAAAEALDRRGIPRSGIAPVFAPEGVADAAPIDAALPLWSNVYVGGVFGDSPWTRAFFGITKRTKPSPTAQRSRLAELLLPGLLHRAFPRGMAVLTDYHQGNDDAKRATDRAALIELAGGRLGITGLAEVAVGAPPGSDTEETWRRLLAPLEPDADGAWRIGDGPALRLLADRDPGIARITLRVVSLARAAAALDDLGIAHAATWQRVSVLIPDTEGLRLELVEE